MSSFLVMMMPASEKAIENKEQAFLMFGFSKATQNCHIDALLRSAFFKHTFEKNGKGSKIK